MLRRLVSDVTTIRLITAVLMSRIIVLSSNSVPKLVPCEPVVLVLRGEGIGIYAGRVGVVEKWCCVRGPKKAG